jgi:hypothetical protein
MKVLLGIIFFFWTCHVKGQLFELTKHLAPSDAIIIHSTKTSCNSIDKVSKVKIFYQSDTSYYVQKLIPYATEIACFKNINYASNKRITKRFLKENDLKLETFKTIRPTPLDSLPNPPNGLVFTYIEKYLPERPERKRTANWTEVKQFCQNVMDSTLTINDYSFTAGHYTIFDIELETTDSTKYLIRNRRFKGQIDF